MSSEPLCHSQLTMDHEQRDHNETYQQTDNNESLVQNTQTQMLPNTPLLPTPAFNVIPIQSQTHYIMSKSYQMMNSHLNVIQQYINERDLRVEHLMSSIVHDAVQRSIYHKEFVIRIPFHIMQNDELMDWLSDKVYINYSATMDKQTYQKGMKIPSILSTKSVIFFKQYGFVARLSQLTEELICELIIPC